MSTDIDDISVKASVGSTKKSRRKGRGNASGFGGECGRGHKGQKSRSGFSRGSGGFEGGQNPLYRRLPKLSGFKSFKMKYVMLNFDQIDSKLPNDSEITLENLVQSGLIKSNEIVKISGQIAPSKKWIIGQGIKLTKSAQTQLEAVK